MHRRLRQARAQHSSFSAPQLSGEHDQGIICDHLLHLLRRHVAPCDVARVRLVLFKFLRGVGFGATNPPVAAGRIVSGAAPTVNPVTVTIGGVRGTVLFSGIVAVGLYQINVVVPSVPSGNQAVQAVVDGVDSPVATVTVQ